MKPLAHIYQPKPPRHYTIGRPPKPKAPTCADCRGSSTQIVGKVWRIVCDLGIVSCPQTCDKFRDARKPAIANEWQVVGG